jgi:hypothetical protein
MFDWLADLPATAPAWWGAFLSSGLAVIKGWELWRDRFRLDVAGAFTSDPQIGNDIKIRNLSTKPLLVTHWEVFYCSGSWPFRKESAISSQDYDSGDFTVAPVTTHTLTFAEESYFSTATAHLKERSVCVRIHIAGRGTFRRTLYPF